MTIHQCFIAVEEVQVNVTEQQPAGTIALLLEVRYSYKSPTPWEWVPCSAFNLTLHTWMKCSPPVWILSMLIWPRLSIYWMIMCFTCIIAHSVLQAWNQQGSVFFPSVSRDVD